jgi:hypothetical protein
LFPEFEAVYGERCWKMFPTLDRIYVNERARAELGWRPTHDFAWALARVAAGERPMSELARTVGAKGYHPVPAYPYTT